MLKRKINPFLLITTILVLAILAGSSVFYQSELNDLVSTRGSLQEDLENKTDYLDKTLEEKSDMNRTIQELESTVQTKNREISEKEQDITELEASLENVENQNSELSNEIEELESNNSNLRNKVDTRNQDIFILCNNNENLNASEEICED